ncbi:hypothetical protein [Chitinophaga nivalis]|uniref:Uncharacterized protein n=1 Tax=Chitinophaga nivalis TaxID=2991709 RepID=A0ABT3IH92_9BACT|nr:hypothetical protein [Chitinophaga nivalis]MCW3466993.1 hypothetical protein [Chitinophaga nivalis]MCW3483316.1 hypothetical protein [Chitinophaga nivalis]
MKQLFILLLLVSGLGSYAKETKVIIRAKARDGKFVGSSLGGAYIIIRNNLNNQILAEGKTAGTTGNTQLIMQTPLSRGGSICDDQTAKFEANIDIAEPTAVSITVYAPLNNRQAQTKVSTELWLIPGKHILGDGIILEIPGFIIDILTPRTHQYIPLHTIAGKPFAVQANMVMMCGCVIQKGGIWNADKIEVKGILKKDGQYIREVELSLIATNLFEGNFPITTRGDYELTVYAYDPATGNTGIDKVNYVVFE